MPCRPAHRELLVHHALEPLLAERLDALELLPFKLLLGETLELSLTPATGEHGGPRLGELLRELVDLPRHIRGILDALGQLPLALLLLGQEFGGHLVGVPIPLPLPVRLDELGLGQARSRLLEQVALAHHV